MDIQWFFDDEFLYVSVEQVQEKALFSIGLELKLGDRYYIIPVSKVKQAFQIPGKTQAKPIFDPHCKLLFESNIREKAFDTEKQVPGPLFPEKERVHTSKTLTSPIDAGDSRLLKPGDVLFQDLDCGPLCDAIESVTQGYQGAKFSHVALVSEVSSSGSVTIVEAIGGKVKETLLRDFLPRSLDAEGKPKVMVGRLKDESVAEKAVEEIKQFVGKAYDDVFDISNDSYYCSELLYFSCKSEGEPVFRLDPMTFKKPGTFSFDPAWEEYYLDLNVSIPEGQPGLNPGGISRSGALEILYYFGRPDGFAD